MEVLMAMELTPPRARAEIDVQEMPIHYEEKELRNGIIFTKSGKEDAGLA
jgi:hypothetical protein